MEPYSLIRVWDSRRLKQLPEFETLTGLVIFKPQFSDGSKFPNFFSFLEIT